LNLRPVVVAEGNVKKDLGGTPTTADWLKMIRPERWMAADVRKLDFEDMKEQEKAQYEAQAARLDSRAGLDTPSVKR
jgi:hypothetical protein